MNPKICSLKRSIKSSLSNQENKGEDVNYRYQKRETGMTRALIDS